MVEPLQKKELWRDCFHESSGFSDIKICFHVNINLKVKKKKPEVYKNTHRAEVSDR